ncbi:beta-galactosidase trimerization domain-containing protein [Actinoplanes subtropicus]|uniref:beta-galactosidase trimerization domain-containing protein n=1 Tax=Actinoplanes subtropicus TaxID=543632 RepID=UPI0004C35831|nr:beta-galactosidase trimerization domain-containing protein [Actinoplanes subtropicus]
MDFDCRAVPAPDGIAPLSLDSAADATRWIEGLTATTAEVIAHYDDRHLGRWPAVTTRAYGAGRITTVGTVPGPRLARDLLRWCDARTGRSRHWRPSHPALTVTSAVNRHGTRLRFVHNWSWDHVPFTVPSGAIDVLSGTPLGVGECLRLGPWDVRVLAEDPPETPG